MKKFTMKIDEFSERKTRPNLCAKILFCKNKHCQRFVFSKTKKKDWTTS